MNETSTHINTRFFAYLKAASHAIPWGLSTGPGVGAKKKRTKAVVTLGDLNKRSRRVETVELTSSRFSVNQHHRDGVVRRMDDVRTEWGVVRVDIHISDKVRIEVDI